MLSSIQSLLILLKGFFMQRYVRFLSSFSFAFLFFAAAPALGANRYMMLDNPIRMSFSGFASSMITVGDVNGDGVSDYLVGAYDYQVRYDPPINGSEHQGRVFVFSGKNGDILFNL